MEDTQRWPLGQVTYQGVIYPNYTDHMGHMNVQFYVHLFDQATWVLVNKVGLSTGYFMERQRGIGAVEQHLQYRREVFPGAVIVIDSRIVDVSDKTLRFVHVMRESQTVVASCELLGVHFDREAHKAVPFPEFIRNAIDQRVIADRS